MKIEEAMDKCPGLKLVTKELLDRIFHGLIGEKLDYNKSWDDNGLDDLYSVEMIMKIEKELDIYITDEVAACFFMGNSKPMVFISKWRDDQLNKILDGN